MIKMKVKVKELKANPFRDLNNYPFNQEKIERLKQSIEQTGFWDNILARQVNGEIQIAYGHHRLKALREVYSPDYLVEVPIKDLSDELMLKIMANENMDEWGVSVGVIDETVRAVKIFLGGNTAVSVKASDIYNFLNWPESRVEDSLSRINAIRKSGVDKKSVETIPTATAATVFTAAVKGKDLTIGQQRRIAKKIAESGDFSVDGVKKAVMDEAYPPQPKQKKQQADKKVLEFTEFLTQTMGEFDLMYKKIKVLNDLRSELTNYSYDDYTEKVAFMFSVEKLRNRLNVLIKNVGDDLTEKSKSEFKNLLNK